MQQNQTNNSFKRKQILPKGIICFLFPLYPIKVFKHVNLIVILSILIGLRLALGFVSVYLPVVGINISISWIPVIVIGWIYGPVFGFICGILTDTISYLIRPTFLWFWLYAIQEPMVGFISGIFSSICTIRIGKDIFKDTKNIGLKNQFYLKDKNKFDSSTKNKIKLNVKFIVEIIIQQLILIGFTTIGIVTLLFWLDQSSFESKTKFDEVFFSYGKYIVLGAILTFFVIMEIIIFFIIKKCDTSKIILCIWVISLVFVISIIFSFVLGTITAPLYYQYSHNGIQSPSFIKYGFSFYLIPRVIKESVKAPFQMIILLGLIPLSKMYLDNAKKKAFLKWSN